MFMQAVKQGLVEAKEGRVTDLTDENMNTILLGEQSFHLPILHWAG